MTYEEVSALAEKLSYRDKLRLAQLLVQLGRKEEEEQNPEKRVSPTSAKPPDAELIKYVADRLMKLRPGKKDGVLNSIGAMFQFQGGVSDEDRERLFSELVHKEYIQLKDNGRIVYSEPGT